MDLIVPRIFRDHHAVVAGMSTRHGGVSGGCLGLNLSFRVGDDSANVRENRRRFYAALPFREDRVAYAAQCHSAVVSRADEPGVHDSCDGLYTLRPGRGLAISVADCVPILLFDPVSGAIAAVHAGWRGSADGIVHHACSLLESDAGTDASGLLAFVGPSAGPCCYEVGSDVSDRFRREVVRMRETTTTLDLKLENTLQLQESGLRRENIEVDSRCTICTPDTFHSYRRDRDASGRMLAFIGLQEI